MYKKAKKALANYLEQVEQDEYTARCHFSGNGTVECFENKLQSFYGVKHALCVDSATNGLLYLALAIGLKNAEIVTSPLSYGATVSGALWLNNKFHFADIDNTLNISPDIVRRIIRENPRVKALYAVDFAGIPHNTFEIRQVCDEFGVWYFADAAQSLGAEINGAKASSLADAFVTSFSAGKTVFCGEGGCILTNNTDLYKRLVTITQHPYRMKRDVGIDTYSELGLNGRINPFAAIVGYATFNQCLQNLKRNQTEILKLYNEIDTFHSVFPFRFAEKQCLPAFFHLPVIVNDEQGFEQQFCHLSIELKRMVYGFHKATFKLLPEQMKRIGKLNAVKSGNIPCATFLMEKLFVLHSKCQKSTDLINFNDYPVKDQIEENRRLPKDF
jgi:Predicted pyridoxal phosphate-dependent enzyme apparently involved in regulation of cell wall biogenesis